MSGTVSVENAIQRVPGWSAQNTTIVERLQGLTNQSFRVRSQNTDYVLRLDGPNTAAYGLDRDRELAILQSAAAAELAPEVVYADDGLLVTLWVNEKPWAAGDIDDTRLESLASLLRQVHELPLSGQPLNLVETARRYADNAHDVDETRVRACLDTVESTPQSSNLRLCHNDVITANILGTERPVLIDWEYACDNDALFDLACFVEYHELEQQQATTLLLAYAGSADPELYGRLNERRRVYSALQFLWFAARPSAAHCK